MWDPEGSTPNVTVSNQETTVVQNLGQIGCCIGLPATPSKTASASNKWYFEVRINCIRGAIFVGVISKKSPFKSEHVRGGKGVGDFPGTWAIDSISGSVGNAGKWRSYAHKFKIGSIIGVCLDLSGETGVLSFTINGQEFGPAFTNLDSQDRYFPAIILKYRLTSATGIFDKFRHCPPSYLPITYQPVELMDQEAAAAHRAEMLNNQDIPLLNLPEEVLTQIMSKMTIFDLGRTATVCRRLNRISTTSSVWKRLLKSELGWKYSPPTRPMDEAGSESIIDYRMKCRTRSNWFNADYKERVEFYPSKSPRALAFSEKVLAVAEDDAVAIYNLNPDDEEYGFTGTLAGDAETIQCMEMQDSLVVAASFDVFLWDAETTLLKHHFSNEPATAINLRGDRLAHASTGRSIKLFDLNQGGQTLISSSAHDKTIVSVQLWENTIFSASANEIKMWDIRAKHSVWTTDDSTGVRSLSYSPTMGTLYSGGDDKIIRTFDIGQRSGVSTVKCSSGIKSMKLQNELLVSAEKMGISIWRIRPDLMLEGELHTKGMLNCFAMSETDLRTATNEKIIHWDYRGDVKYDYKFKRKKFLARS